MTQSGPMALDPPARARPRLDRGAVRAVAIPLGGALALWAAAVALLAHRGVFLAMAQPAIAALVAAGILMPTAVYAVSPSLRAFFAEIGLYPLTALHVWRIPAALAFFAYGAAGALPTTFWALAGAGDLLVGLYALKLAFRRPSRRGYLRFHLFGFADFVMAVGMGLTFTLLGDPRMATIAVLPMALIPLFGVGVSGATHLIAFNLLRRRA